jgi:O-antigen/teichoic acid export membrane protein
MNFSLLRKTLQAGSVVFGFSALFLLALPKLFLDLLGIDQSDSLIWSMRMIAITLFALSGNMWNNSKQEDNNKVANVAKIMCVSAFALGVLTLMIPAELTWFSYVYAGIGFGFALSYLVGIGKGFVKS